MIMEEKLKFIQMLHDDLVRNTKIYIKNLRESDRKIFTASYGSKNHGKTVLKRKIIYLRQELLNLEKMLDGE